jgi:hypothetical protein
MLVEWLLAGAGALSLPIGAYAGIRAKRGERARWNKAAEEAGLEEVVPATGFWSKGILTARSGRHAVRVEEFARDRYDRGVRLVIDGNSGLTLRAEKDVDIFQRAGGPREVQIGDEAFDNVVFIEGGDPAVLRAVLDVGTRGLVRRFLEGGVRVLRGGMMETRCAIQDGSLVMEVPKAADLVLRANFTHLIQGPLELARRLERPSGVVKRLVENTRQEPGVRMRLENLKLLAGTFPHHAVVRELLAAGCDDEHQEVQLHSAMGLGVGDASGRAKLLEIASREWSDDPVAARAVAALGKALPPDQGTAILVHALRTRRHQTARACLQVLGESGGPGVLDTLVKVMRVERGDLSVRAARALGATGLAAAEAPLLEVLDDDDAALRLAAAEALGNAGSSAAVLALKQAAERDGGLRRAARQAIANIQSRLGATPGQVSLAEGGAGALTLTGEGPEGQVSLPR